MEKQTKKTKFGIYDMMDVSDETVPIYFLFTPCITVYHYSFCIEGAFYIGWLNYMIYIPYDDKREVDYQFSLLPFFSWRKFPDNKQYFSFSWLFWTISIPYSN